MSKGLRTRLCKPLSPVSGCDSIGQTTRKQRVQQNPAQSQPVRCLSPLSSTFPLPVPLQQTGESINLVFAEYKGTYKMIPSPFTAHRPLDIDSSSSQKILSAGEQHTHSGYYRPSGQGDIFLFSPSLCSRPSNESTSLSSCSFDTLSYSFSPTDLSSAPKPFSPSPLVPGTTRSRSPLFVEAYLSGSEPNPVTRFSPSTPFQELFNSSPAGYWQANSLSVSPISRHSSAPAEQDPADADEEDCEEDIEKAPSRKIESLLQYGKVQDIPDSPPAPRASSPSTLSSLSSVPSSPSALFSGAPVASSQTSQGPTPSSSPSNNPSLPSPLASPFKLFPKAATRAAPGTPTRRRSRRLQPMHGTASRGLAAEILNQLGRSRLNVADAPKPNISPPFKLSSSPMPNLSDSDDENYEPVAGARCNTNKRVHARNLAQTSLSKRKKRRTESTVRASSASSSNSAHSASTSTSHALASVSRGETAATEECATDYPNRTFPLRIPIHDNFPLFYRRFPVSSVIDEVLAAYDLHSRYSVPCTSR